MKSDLDRGRRLVGISAIFVGAHHQKSIGDAFETSIPLCPCPAPRLFLIFHLLGGHTRQLEIVKMTNNYVLTVFDTQSLAEEQATLGLAFP